MRLDPVESPDPTHGDKVKDGLDRVNPIADQHYQLANTYYRLGNLKEAIASLQAALQVNPNHLKARLLLGETLCEQGALDVDGTGRRGDPDAEHRHLGVSRGQ